MAGPRRVSGLGCGGVIGGQQPCQAACSLRADRGGELAGDAVQVERAVRVLPELAGGAFLRVRQGRRASPPLRARAAGSPSLR